MEIWIFGSHCKLLNSLFNDYLRWSFFNFIAIKLSFYTRIYSQSCYIKSSLFKGFLKFLTSSSNFFFSSKNGVSISFLNFSSFIKYKGFYFKTYFKFYFDNYSNLLFSYLLCFIYCSINYFDYYFISSYYYFSFSIYLICSFFNISSSNNFNHSFSSFTF